MFQKQLQAQFVQGVIGSHNLIVDDKPQIAFIGRSNVGKSSLINMLTGQKNLVRSSRTPGKTQEINFFEIGGERYFVDLPGYGYARISQKHREKLRKLILWYFISGEAPVTRAVLIVDAKAGLRDFDEEMIAVLQEQGYDFVVIANKIDKLNQKALHASLESIKEKVGADVSVLPASAATGRGREKILEQLLS